MEQDLCDQGGADDYRAGEKHDEHGRPVSAAKGLSLAHQLYGLLLKPVDAGWRDAKSLVVATNGALGELPLGVLPIAPSQIEAQAMPLFASYRDVPWLARSYAVTMLRHRLASTATHGSVQQSFHLPPTLLLKSCSQRNFEVVQSIRSWDKCKLPWQHHD
jgi:hypothetical protein